MGSPEILMKRTRIHQLVLAITLAVILPLEQGHCAFMGLQNHGAPCCAMASAAPTSAAKHAAAPMHACCAKAAARSRVPGPPAIPSSCLCAQLPIGTLPSVSISIHELQPTTLLAAIPAASFVAPVSVQSEIQPALDVGSPPLLNSPGALASRAPPVSA
jgi:hypothetical protein